MVLNYIWIGFFVVAFIIALVKVIFSGRYGDIYSYHERYIRFFKDSFSRYLWDLQAYWLFGWVS